MMRLIIVTAFYLLASNLFAQQQQDSTIVLAIKSLESKVTQQQREIEKLYSELNKEYRTYRIVKEDLNQTITAKQEEVIDSLNALIDNNNHKLAFINNELESKINQTEQSTNTKTSELYSSISINRLYWIITTLAIFLVGGIIYWLLGKRIASGKTDVENQIRNTKTSLEEESVKLDSKLIEVLETQLKLKQEEFKVQANVSKEKADHSLALKVADEIIRIQKNLGRMDENTKGLKQLNSSVKRIQDNFASNGYELVDMLDKEYNEGLKATVNFIQDEDYEEGIKIITRIIKPQVNYQGKMIQPAQIEVTEA